MNELEKLAAEGRAEQEKKRQESNQEAIKKDKEEQERLEQGKWGLKLSVSPKGFYLSEDFIALLIILGFVVIPVSIALLINFPLGGVALPSLWIAWIFWVRSSAKKQVEEDYQKRNGLLEALPFKVENFWKSLEAPKVLWLNIFVYFKDPLPEDTMVLQALVGLKRSGLTGRMQAPGCLEISQSPLSRKHENFAVVEYFDFLCHSFLKAAHKKYPIEKVILSPGR